MSGTVYPIAVPSTRVWSDPSVVAVRAGAFVRLFLLAAGLRLGMSCYFLWHFEDYIRGDSINYHARAIALAERYLAGTVDWWQWVDEAWPQFMGLLYAYVGPYPWVVMACNALFVGVATVLVLRIAMALCGHAHVALAAATLFAVFPSGIFFHSLLLKEAVACLGVVSLVWGTILMRNRAPGGARWLALGFLIVVGVRVYLVPLLALCVLVGIIPIRYYGRLRDLLLAIGLAVVVGIAALYTLRTMNVDFSEYEMLSYLDLNRMNYLRSVMVRGSAAMYASGEQAKFGQGILSDLWLIGKGVFFFLLGVDPTNLRSTRQYMAVPEMLAFVWFLPALITGVRMGWRHRPSVALPILLIAVVITLVYGAGATNLGAMYRWRLQGMPLLFILIVYGGAIRRNPAILAWTTWTRRLLTAS